MTATWLALMMLDGVDHGGSDKLGVIRIRILSGMVTMVTYKLKG